MPRPSKPEKSHPSAAIAEPSLKYLPLCFFLSGAAALIYQVSWTKSLGLLFGYSAYSLATVLTAFMAGLALGSAFLARWNSHESNFIKLYARLEFLIAATAAFSFLGLRFVRAIYLSSGVFSQSHSFQLIALRFLGAVLVLFLPTFLMGGTFPVMIRAVTTNASQLASRTGRFYALNTFGAVTGTLAAGFVLLPIIGLRATIAAAVLLNLLAGALALLSQPAALPSEPSPDSKSPAESEAAPSKFLLLTFALVGATAISYEIAWTRLLATPLGSSTYAFSLMLATMLFGIALGSFVFDKWIKRNSNVSSHLFALTQLAIAAAALLFLMIYCQLPALIPPLLRFTNSSFSGLLFTQLVICALAMLPAAILFGFNFPAVIALICGPTYSHRSSRSVGFAYAANTAGAILAAILTGFFLVPRFGSFRVVALTALLNLTVAVALQLREKPFRWKPVAVAAVLIVAVGLVGWSSVFYSRTIASFGAVLYGNFHDSRLTVQELADTEDILFFEDGINASIAVTRSDDYVALKTNGKVDASNVDASTQLLLGDLGAVLHPNPKRVLIIGFGGGMTASAVSRFPDVERIDCVEIEPAVLRAATHLERLHRGVLNDPRLHIYFEDARNFLQTSRDSYDLIISEPSNPWIAGIASLYTTEFYSVVRQHLADNGIFVQWVQAYGLAPEDFRMIAASLSPHFADVSLWRSSGRDFLLLARANSDPLSFKRSRKLWPNALLQQDFQTLKLSRPESWPVYFQLSDHEIRALAAGAQQNTDDKTLLEYRAPRRLLAEALTEDLRNFISEARTTALPANLASSEKDIAQLASLESALDLNSADAARFAKPPSSSDLSDDWKLALARLDLQAGKIEQATIALAQLSHGPTNRQKSKYWLVESAMKSNDPTTALQQLSTLLSESPNDSDALRVKSKLSADLKDWGTAASTQERLLSVTVPAKAVDYCQLGDYLMRSGNFSAAEKPFREGLHLDPYSFLCHRELGELLRANKNYGEAATHLQFVLKHFPEADPKAYASLALASQAVGDKQGMQDALAKGKRIFPNDPLWDRIK